MREGVYPVGPRSETKPGLGHAEQMAPAVGITLGLLSIICRLPSAIVTGNAVQFFGNPVVPRTPVQGL